MLCLQALMWMWWAFNVGVLATSVWIAHGCVLTLLSYIFMSKARGVLRALCRSRFVCVLCIVILVSTGAQCTVPQVLWQ